MFFSVANPQYSKAEVWDGFQSAIQSVVDAAGNLTLSFYDASGTNQAVGVPVSSLTPEVAAMIGQPSGGGNFYSTEFYEYAFPDLHIATIEQFINNPQWIDWGWLVDVRWQNCGDYTIALESGSVDGDSTIDFETFTNNYPCDDPLQNFPHSRVGSLSVFIHSTVVGGCPDPLVDSQGYCLFPDAAGNVPLITFNADGSINLSGGTGDIPYAAKEPHH
jgi:hypothetical protein